jgi:hypothetical protein
MWISALIPVAIGAIFFYAYVEESKKKEPDTLFLWTWFFLGLAMLICCFFMNIEVTSTSAVYTALNATTVTTYTYGPDMALETLGYAFGGVAVVIGIIVCIRLIWTRVNHAIA